MIYCWNILYISILWVDTTCRKLGYGSQLLEYVEQEAFNHGCALAHLSTFDFQAQDFCIRHGYEVYGSIPNCPPGHTRFSLYKKLKSSKLN